ncbi:MAG: GspH/FimT family pseudopilin [Candidatus Thiodiazotropha sp. (ex Dulcina madagascariensis)]|nr:GspH/FimT family pseudopilin [Candidatus Thiodiazotropha sp. (ex Dulcina madagascariensis)]
MQKERGFYMYRKKGFTLIELLIAVVIAAVLATVAIPSLISLTQRNTVTGTGHDLLGALMLARSQAAADEENTIFTPLANGWQVDNTNVLNPVNHLTHTVDNDNITIAGNAITYNSRGRAALLPGASIDISYDGELLSRVCLSLTGRPFIRSVKDGACP